MWRRETLISRFLRSIIPEKIPWFAAPLYDRLARSAYETYYKEVAESVTASIRQGLILDIGTGPGYLPLKIAENAPQVRVIGIDSSKALVSIARKNAQEAGLSDRVEFVKCDGKRLAFEDDSYDLVISTGSLHAWKNPILVINECFRVLKPGSEVWILDPAQVSAQDAIQLMEQGLTGMDRLAHWWGSFTSKLTPPYTGKEMEEIVRVTKFAEGDITEGKWLTVKLRKRAAEASRADP